MFRRFMIVCWALFLIGCFGAVGGFVGVMGAAAQNQPETVYQNMFFFGSILAQFMLPWNVIWHIAHWIWKWRKES